MACTKEAIVGLRFKLPAKWFPVQAFFNAVSDDDFPRMVKDLVGHIGWHVDVSHCEFPEGLEPDEEPFEGAKFSLYQEEVVLSQDDLASVLATVCRVQKRRLPKQAHALDAALLELDVD